MQALEYSEEFAGVAHIEANAIVFYVVVDFGTLDPRSNFYDRVLIQFGILDCVGDQVQPNLLDRCDVTAYWLQCADPEFYFGFIVFTSYFITKPRYQFLH